MNDMIQTLLNHRSIRSYLDKPLAAEQIELKTFQATIRNGQRGSARIVGLRR